MPTLSNRKVHLKSSISIRLLNENSMSPWGASLKLYLASMSDDDSTDSNNCSRLLSVSICREGANSFFWSISYLLVNRFAHTDLRSVNSMLIWVYVEALNLDRWRIWWDMGYRDWQPTIIYFLGISADVRWTLTRLTFSLECLIYTIINSLSFVYIEMMRRD